MASRPHPLILISCKVLLQAEHAPTGSEIFRGLATLSRSGCHLLLTEAEPDQWFPTRHHRDGVLASQGRLQALVQEAGGDLDGIYYVPRSVFTQDRNRLGAIEDILSRYGAKPDSTTMVSSSKAFLKAAGKIGVTTRAIPKEDRAAVETLSQVTRSLVDASRV